MKLSEKIQEALRQQQEINLSDPAVQKRLAAQWGYVPADAQPAPSFADAYQGAMEGVAIWKKRALEAEDLNRKFVAEINGPAYMGEPAQKAVAYLDIGAGGYMDIGTDLTDEQLASLPKGRHMLGIVGTYGVDGYVSAQPAPSIPDGWLRAIDEALIVAHIGVANESDTYEQAKSKLDSLICLHVNVATDPAVNGGWKLVPVEPTYEMLEAGEDTCVPTYTDTPVSVPFDVYSAMIAAAPEPKP